MKKKKFKNYICLVDYYKPLYLQRRTRGRYRVGAKNEKEAKQFVQKAIGFGSVMVYYQASELLVDYKEVFREKYNPNLPNTKEKNYGFELLPIIHATAPVKKKGGL